MEDGPSPIDLPGACAAHYNDTPERRTRLHEALKDGRAPEAIAIDDGAAVVFRGRSVERALTWRDGSSAYAVRFASGKIEEEAYPCERI